MRRGEHLEDLIVDPYVLVDLGLRYAFGGMLSGVELSADLNNVLDDEVLLYGNVGVTGPQFFPLATRHLFVRVRYTVD